MYKYDVALSYESDSQDFVQEVEEFLKADGWEVFFAPGRKKELLSENLKKELYKIYYDESLVKVLFVTEKYLESQYTMLEKRRALSSARENPRRLIVVNFIGEKLPKELKPYVYLEDSIFSDDIAFQISNRIDELKNGDSDKETDKETKAGKEEKGAKSRKYNIITDNHGIIFGDNSKLDHTYFKMD